MYSDFIRDFICVQGTHVVDTQGADPSQRGAAQRGLVPRFQPDKFSFLGGALGRTRLARQRTVKDDFFEPFRCFKSLLSSSGEGRGRVACFQTRVEILPISFVITLCVILIVQAYLVIYAPPVGWKGLINIERKFNCLE